MIGRDRLLAKLDELDGYLAELRSIATERFEEYLSVEKKRAYDDQIVFETIRQRLGDFDTFKREILAFLRKA